MKSFRHKEIIPIKDQNDLEKQTIDKTIDFLLLILKNLGFLNTSTIEKKINEKFENQYDKSILYRLRISRSDSSLSNLEKYFSATEFGYGEVKINEIKNRYNILVAENTKLGKNYLEIIKDLIFETKLEISRYESILVDFSETLKIIIRNEKLTKVEAIVLIDYWTTHYKEEKLGHLPCINQKIVAFIEDLKNLEYDGYGEIEINKFLEKCKLALSRMKKNNASDEEMIDYIRENIFFPLKQKYKNELAILKKRIAIIENSKEISKRDKELEIEKFIIDFNERCGHKVDLSNQLLEMKNTLKNLRSTEDDNYIVDCFMDKAQTIAIKEKSAKKPDKLILAIIRVEYKKYFEYYKNRLEKLEKHLKSASLKETAIESFKVGINYSPDFGLLIDQMVTNLKNSGNFSLEEIENFKYRCQEIERESIFTSDKQKFQEKIENLYEELMTTTELARKNQLDSLKTKVITFSKELATLEGNGYNEHTIHEFQADCEEIINTRNPYREKELIISQKYRLLKEIYYENLRVFTLWKNIELAKKTKSKEEIESTMKHLLSLSPKELQLYYEEDDRKKRESMEMHNKRILVKFLAEEEAKIKKNDAIVSERLKSFALGFVPYSLEELERARDRVEERQYLLEENKLTKDEKLISVPEYINSTLFKQISNIKISMQKN